ncbi:MAG: hypothetical protein ACLU84_02135 [Clostridia bacterium]
MSKLYKFIALFLVAFFTLFTTSCYATDINMNLTGENEQTPSSNTVNTPSTNTNTSTNTVSDTTTTVGGVTSNPKDEGLTMGHILNILLIVVGVVLILLGIAILIRLKS